MTETKFTPGPWKVDTDMFGTPHVYDSGGDRLCNERAHSPLEQKANAHLIAAAVDMYEAAKVTLDTLMNMTPTDFELGRDHEIREKLRAALAKARGET